MNNLIEEMQDYVENQEVLLKAIRENLIEWK